MAEGRRWRKCWRTRTLYCQAHPESSKKNPTLLFNAINTSTWLDLLLNFKPVFLLYELQISYFFNHPWNSTNGTWNLYYYKNRFLSPNSFEVSTSQGEETVTGKHVWKSELPVRSSLGSLGRCEPRCAVSRAEWFAPHRKQFVASLGVFCSSVLLSPSFWNFLQNLSLDPK